MYRHVHAQPTALCAPLTPWLAGGSSQPLQPPLGQRCAEANVDEHRRTSEATAADLAVHLLVKHAVKKIVKVLSTSGNVEIQRGKAGLIAR
jgi:hypothetical protein